MGNKTDLYVDRMITTDQGKRLANSWNAAFLETSAKQNEVSTDAFPISKYIAKFLLNAFSVVCCRYFSHTTKGDRESQWERTRKAELYYLLNCLNQWL